jgi:hypothetical protein
MILFVDNLILFIRLLNIIFDLNELFLFVNFMVILMGLFLDDHNIFLSMKKYL